MNPKVWVEWSRCCALALLMMSADAIAQTHDGDIRTLESSMKKKQSRQAVVVTLSGDRDVQAVVRDLKASGFQAAQVLDAIGVVTGSAASKSLAKLRKVRGVKDVSQDYKVDIGPPGAPVS
jgi:hypothetical protein